MFFALFAAQNTQTADIYISQYTIPDVPVFLLVLISLLIGLFLAWLMHIISDVSSKMTIKEHKKELKELNNKIAEVTKEVHKLELENTKYKSKLGEEEFDEESI